MKLSLKIKKHKCQVRYCGNDGVIISKDNFFYEELLVAIFYHNLIN